MKKTFICLFTFLHITSLFAQTSYWTEIKSVLREIDLLPSLFYVAFDKPKEIKIYSEYDKKTKKAIEVTDSCEYETKYEIKYFDKNNMITQISIISTGNYYGEKSISTSFYSVSYDKNNRIKKIVEEYKNAWIGILDFEYTENKIIVKRTAKNFKVKGTDSVIIYEFDLTERKYTKTYKNNTTKKTYNLIKSGVTETYITEELNFPIKETIYEYDDKGRLAFYVRVYYDKESSILKQDFWNNIYRIIY